MVKLSVGMSKSNIDKITYGREEGGFAVYVNGEKQSVFRVKGWNNKLRETPEYKPTGYKKKSSFERTQYEYNGRWD